MSMGTPIEVKIAELCAGDKTITMTTNGVGSCIVIILHDQLMRMSGLAHAILPKAKPDSVVKPASDNSIKRFVKYADLAIDTLIDEIEALGGHRENLVAKLVGGAHMFSLLEGDDFGIGWENIMSARAQLGKHHIKIETEVVGGTVGRNIRLDCATGIVEITTKV